MLRTLIHGLVILHLGPGIAFALLAFGCEGPAPVLGAACTRDTVSSFALLTAGSWSILLAALGAGHCVQRARKAAPPATGPRAAALLALAATGVLIGVAGVWLTGHPAGFWAIPGAVAVGWWFLANPLACQSEAVEGSPGRREARR
jgi:hypothetical protein